mmetsp:Transcript_12672/g.24376  ORF Transcript_12672/g.24376 Transcript_12672/m.24376 type:complete len:447 (+) Transcript_12672:97-1437(+)|eukprot:CAMPEP_0175158706 /NCGR_PEP_ID=MMETSP0087-20121206/22978_1 /TAXON_ID=136419 /ORGANISM="Unknown Unknown, Strain D1" /LENGTH=446 /DNA_ID=CAMNT_0016446599 /DNA_START=88 /DNA_END=1428 /DNA_ORIENTATION=-
MSEYDQSDYNTDQYGSEAWSEAESDKPKQGASEAKHEVTALPLHREVQQHPQTDENSSAADSETDAYKTESESNNKSPKEVQTVFSKNNRDQVSQEARDKQPDAAALTAAALFADDDDKRCYETVNRTYQKMQENEDVEPLQPQTMVQELGECLLHLNFDEEKRSELERKAIANWMALKNQEEKVKRETQKLEREKAELERRQKKEQSEAEYQRWLSEKVEQDAQFAEVQEQQEEMLRRQVEKKAYQRAEAKRRYKEWTQTVKEKEKERQQLQDLQQEEQQKSEKCRERAAKKAFNRWLQLKTRQQKIERKQKKCEGAKPQKPAWVDVGNIPHKKKATKQTNTVENPRRITSKRKLKIEITPKLPAGKLLAGSGSAVPSVSGTAKRKDKKAATKENIPFPTKKASLNEDEEVLKIFFRTRQNTLSTHKWLNALKALDKDRQFVKKI